MERKRKAHEITSTEPHNQTETNDVQVKEEQNDLNIAENSRAGSPTSENVAPLNQHYPSFPQWPPSQSPPTIAVSGKQGQPPPPPPHGSPPPSTGFWLPYVHGYHFPGMYASTVYQPFTPLGTIAPMSPQVSSATGSVNHHTRIPNFGYPVGYPYPAISVSSGPLTQCGQVQYPQIPNTYAFPGAYSCISTQPPTVLGYSASTEQVSVRGVIKPPAKLSRKHQQLWEAQSAENVRLWTAISQLRAELADCKSHVKETEGQVSSLKDPIEGFTSNAIGHSRHPPARKRGRPKKSVAYVDALPSTNEPQAQVRSRNPVQWKFQTKDAEHIFEKVVLKKVENKEKPCNTITSSPQEVEMSNMVTDKSRHMVAGANNQTRPSFCNQFQQGMPSSQLYRVGHGSSTGMKSTDDKTKDPNNACAELSKQAKVLNSTNAFATSSGARGNFTFGWHSTVTSADMSFPGFNHNGSVVREGGKDIPGSSFACARNTSEQLNYSALAAKDKSLENLEDDAISS